MLNVFLKGHNYEYEVSTLIKTFGYSNLKFVNNLDEANKEELLINEIIQFKEKYIIKSLFFKNGESISFEETEISTANIDDDITKRKIIKRNIKLIIFDTLKKIIPVNIPWGILTGIRPTKIVHELIDRNKSSEGIRTILKDDYRLAENKANLLLNVAYRERKFIYPIREDLVSIYIGIPFCPTRCVYCSFPANTVHKNENKIENYINSLLKEINDTDGVLRSLGKSVQSIYIGGGTPTTLSPYQLERLCDTALKSFGSSELKEFTVEAGRPDTIDIDKLRGMKKYNVDRISINPQSMNQKTLDTIGRNHTVDDIKKSYFDAKNIGFKTINMDIILGLPGEGMNEVEKTLKSISELSPENLTIHTLAVKRSSKLNKDINEYPLIKDGLANEMLDYTQNHANKMDYHPYYMYRQKHMVGNLENIGYAKEGHECIYNMQIMEEKQSIIALGAGAASKIVYPKENRLERVANVKNVDEYINRVDEMVERKRKELFR